jgi:hypothetical protein
MIKRTIFAQPLPKNAKFLDDACKITKLFALPLDAHLSLAQLDDLPKVEL